jgi:hypothetical protein
LLSRSNRSGDLHALGNPLRIEISGGQVHDSLFAEALLAGFDAADQPPIKSGAGSHPNTEADRGGCRMNQKPPCSKAGDAMKASRAGRCSQRKTASNLPKRSFQAIKTGCSANC